MILPGGAARVFVATKPVSFWKSLDRLSAVVQEQLKLGLFGSGVFVFRAKRADQIDDCKALPCYVSRLKALVHTEQAENGRLRTIIKEFQHAQFGHHSEKIDPKQLRAADQENLVNAV
ncbi:MAG: IS66 family insertion sequence element accessory protein TnpB [Geminicoccaceae bacterium]